MYNIKRFIMALRTGRAQVPYLDMQIEAAERFRDMLGVARKERFPVVISLQVQGLEQGAVVAGDGPEAEFLYNFACGQLLRLQTERSEANLGGKGVKGNDVRQRGGGAGIARQGP